MYSHVMVGSNDLERSKKFYDALFTAISGPVANVDSRGRLFYTHNNSIFAVTPPIDGNAAIPANGGTIGIACESIEQVEALHEAGITNGGTSIEDPPGKRDTLIGPLYLCYVRDPDGNKLCGLHYIKE